MDGGIKVSNTSFEGKVLDKDGGRPGRPPAPKERMKEVDRLSLFTDTLCHSEPCVTDHNGLNSQVARFIY